MVNFQRMIKDTLRRKMGDSYKKYNVVFADDKEGFTILLINKTDSKDMLNIKVVKLEEFGNNVDNEIKSLSNQTERLDEELSPSSVE